MKNLFVFSGKLLLSLAFTFFLIEAGLQLFPTLVPIDLLVYFNETPRTKIARSQGLPTKEWDTIVLARDDGGPELRLFKPYTPLKYSIKEYDATKILVMDEIGFCNAPGSYQAAQINVMALGDSFTTCHAVELDEVWTQQLALSTGFSIYNLGRGGVGVHEYLQILKKFGLQKSPKIVIMNIFAGNDFRDAASYYFHRLEHNQPQAEVKPLEATVTPASSPPDNFFLRHSYALNLGYAVLQYNASAPPPLRVNNDDDDDDSDGPHINFRYQLVFPGDIAVPFNLRNTDKDEVEHAYRLFQKEIDPGVFRALEEALQEFVELSKKHNFAPVISYTPSVHTTYTANVVFEDARLAVLMPWYSQEQRQYFQRKSEALGFIFIDLTPAMQAAAQAGDPQHLLYYRHDLHLTPAGHLTVAKALDQALRDLGLVTGSID